MNDRTNGAADTGGVPDEHADAGQSHAKRGGTRAAERIAGLDTSGAGVVAQVNQLTQQLEAATRKAEEAEAGWQRARADFANFKRRSEEERAEVGARASDSLLLKVVALADDFDLAIEHVPADAADSPWMEGIRAIDRKLRTVLESEGVTPMQAEGQLFDPHQHQAISHEATTEAPDGTVLRELQRGYTVRDRVLRPALVAVASNNDTTNEQDQGMDKE
jgi:molecular chaperone GrpE